MVKLTVCGIGPGDPKLITLAALEALGQASLVLVPQTVKKDGSLGERGMAADVVAFHRPDAPVLTLPFPMIRDAERRDAALLAALQEAKPRWENAEEIVFPLLGDSALFATAVYLVRQWKKLTSLTVRWIPGVSAHSALACAVGQPLAQDDQVLVVAPATTPRHKLETLARLADGLALYKASVLEDDLTALSAATGPWQGFYRGDDLSLLGEQIFEGPAALSGPRPYMSTSLWRKQVEE